MTAKHHDFISQIIAHWDDEPVKARTHAESCWQWHPRCAIRMLGWEVESLATQLADKNIVVNKLLAKIVTEPYE
jgi:hypothetical protein